LGELFTADAMWEGKGRYAKAFGQYHGRDAIVEMIRSYCEPVHFAMTAHFFSSEDIRVDGDSAAGHWMMLQTSDYASGTADFRSARLTMRFARNEGVWRIAHFRTENIFSRQVERWNDEEIIAVPDQIAHGAKQ
jgi:ketosteroid isomerase-like protein